MKLAAPLVCLLLPMVVLFFAVGGPPFPGPALTILVSCGIGIGSTLLSDVFFLPRLRRFLCRPVLLAGGPVPFSVSWLRSLLCAVKQTPGYLLVCHRILRLFRPTQVHRPTIAHSPLAVPSVAQEALSPTPPSPANRKRRKRKKKAKR